MNNFVVKSHNQSIWNDEIANADGRSETVQNLRAVISASWSLLFNPLLKFFLNILD